MTRAAWVAALACLLRPALAAASRWTQPQLVVDDVEVEAVVAKPAPLIVGTEHWLPAPGDVVVRAKVTRVEELVSAWAGHGLPYVGQAGSIVYVAVDRTHAVRGAHVDVLLQPSPIFGTELGAIGVTIATQIAHRGDRIVIANGELQSQDAGKLRLDLTCARWEIGALDHGPREQVTIAAIFRRDDGGASSSIDTAPPRSDYVSYAATTDATQVGSLHARGQLRSDGKLGGAFRGDLALELLPSPEIAGGDVHLRFHLAIAADGSVTDMTTTKL